MTDIISTPFSLIDFKRSAEIYLAIHDSNSSTTASQYYSTAEYGTRSQVRGKPRRPADFA